jgi:isocitrate dehydrogenase (NAD+)
MAPGANIGADAAIFEAVHGSAPDIAGKGVANPTALLLSAIAMLEHLDLPEHARRVRAALLETIAAGTRTADLGGSATTREFARAISERLG